MLFISLFSLKIIPENSPTIGENGFKIDTLNHLIKALSTKVQKSFYKNFT